MTAALFELSGHADRHGIVWSVAAPADVNPLLAREHYLGPLTSGGHSLIVSGSNGSATVAAQVWRRPTSRRLPSDGTWLELSRWCLTPEAGDNAGSRMHKWAARLIREHLPKVTTLVSYSDPGHGHDGALYRASNWLWRPTWLRLRPPPGGHGAWVPDEPQGIKDRWIFPLRPDPARESATYIDDPGAIRHWRAHATKQERRWARAHPQLKETP